MKQLPATFAEALRAGYRVTGETTKTTGARRSGTLHLRDGARPELTVAYEADRKGYRFGKPEQAS